MDILVENGKAKNLFPDGAPELHPSITVVRDYVGDVKEGYEWDGTVFTAPAPEPEPTYEEKRRAEYPPVEDYLDAVVKDDSVALQAYKDACLAVKAKYPKG